MININYNTTLSECVRNYVTFGFAIHPLIPKRKEPLTKNGLKDASKDLNQITAWLDRCPDANIGIATGSVSGVWVLDVDGEDGEASLKDLLQKHGDFPKTKEVITGTGGKHIYFLMPPNTEISNSVRRLAPGLDVRGDGGYVVAPPSIHPNGKAYKWSENNAETIQSAPEWLLNLLKTPPDYARPASSSDWRELVKGVSEGQRNDALARVSGALLASKIEPEIALELCVGWNDSFCEPPMDHDEVERTFNSIAQREARKPRPDDSEVDLVCLADVKMEKINWLWPDRIARGKLAVIAGDPGLGKSQITASIASIVSAGQKWPDTDTAVPEGKVLILSAEDDMADTIKPRLVAAGGNVKNCHVLKAVTSVDNQGKKIPRGFDLKQDVRILEKAIAQLGNVSLIIIDPISAYMGKTDSNNNSEVRGLLAPLTKLAEQTNVAVIVVTHLNKSQNPNMLSRVIGSIGLVAASRCSFGVIKDEGNADVRYLIPIKSNIGNDKNGFVFQIEGVTLEDNIQTSKIRWDRSIDVQDALKSCLPDNEPPATEAGRFLKEILANGPKLKTEIDALASEAGINDASLQRAKKRLGYATRKTGFDDGRWEWYKPTTSSQPSEPTPPSHA